MNAAGLTLTPTDRLARALREEFAVRQRQSGATVWQTPQIKSLRQWVQDSWTASWPAEQLLNSSQQLALWLEAVETVDHNLISPRSCAREAMQAARVAAQWGIDPRSVTPWTDEHRAWLGWHTQVRQRMQDQRWLVPEDLYSIVRQWIQDGTLSLSTPITLQGFRNTTNNVLEQSLLDTLCEYGRVSHHAYDPISQPLASGLAFPDNRAQYRYVARCVRERLQATIDDENHLPRILIVCPDDNASQASLQAALTDLVAPWLRQAGGADAVPWRWQNGHPLNENPWIDVALALITLDERNNRPEIISRVLLSATLWSDQARELTARLDFKLRERGYPQPSLHVLLQELYKDEHQPLLACLSQLKDVIRAEPRNALPSAWAQHFQIRLDIMGWPGENTLSSAAWQHVQEFRAELARLASLDAMLGSISIGNARKWLNELCQRRFTPRAEHQQPVHILSPRDLDDVRLDQDGDLLIITGASADIYPGTASATPFLPIDVQIAAGVPEARADSLLRQQQQRIRSALGNSRETLLCVCSHSDEGADLLPTPLVAVDWQSADDEATPLSAAERMAAMPDPCAMPDTDPVPPVSPEESIHGSTDLFKLWAESPFLSFCKVRLGIKPMPVAGRGLPNSIQGTLLHEALDQIMGEHITASSELQSRDEAALTRLVSEVLGPLMQRMLPAAEYGHDLIRLEEDRMRGLLLQWLRHEQRRTHPFRIVHHEDELHGNLAGLPLKLRVDRVDEVSTEQGLRYLVIDYKTGKEVKPAGWKADSLKEPQLPLYAILGAGNETDIPQIDGICFAHLKDGHPALSACTNWTLGLIPSDKAPIKHKLEDWPNLLTEWHIKVTQIAADFMAGVAGLDASKVNHRGFNADYLQLAGTAATGEDEE